MKIICAEKLLKVYKSIIFTSILAGGGMGKSTAMKYVAVSWADGTSEELKTFDFVFHISLKHVKKGTNSIEEIIVSQHCRLEAMEINPLEIRNILQTNEHRVLLLLDGHDEYKTGFNADIDAAIQKRRLGDLWMVITSRETEQLDALREDIDAEVEIRGFDESNVKLYILRYMDNDKQKATQTLREIERRNISFSNSILKVPMLLNMVCALCDDSPSDLPETKTEIIGFTVQRCVNREAVKISKKKLISKVEKKFNMPNWPDDVAKAFLRLGELSWKKLNEHWKNTLFEKVCGIYLAIHSYKVHTV